MGNRNNGIGQTGRAALAGEGGRNGDDVGGIEDGHGRVSVGAEAARRFSATSSDGATAPDVRVWMRAAVRADAPLTRNLNFRTASLDSPVAVATSASDKPLTRMKSPSVISAFQTEAPSAPTMLPTARLAEVLAILVAEIVGLMPGDDQGIALERLANRLDTFGRTTGGGEAAGMLGAVASRLMALEV